MTRDQPTTDARPTSEQRAFAALSMHAGPRLVRQSAATSQERTSRSRADRADHWHFVGCAWRPLHEQLSALDMAGSWASVFARATHRRNDMGGIEVSSALRISSALYGNDYAAVVVSGAVDAAGLVRLRDYLYGIHRVGIRDVVIECSAVTELDPRFGIVVDRLHRWLRARRGGVTLVGVPQWLESDLTPLLRDHLAVCANHGTQRRHSDEAGLTRSTSEGPGR